MPGVAITPLAPAGSTGNNTHSAAGVAVTAGKLAVDFIVEVAGGTPTVTFKLQGTLKAAPASTDWFDVAVLPSDSDTAVITKVVTAVGSYGTFVSQYDVARFVRQVRLVTSANTNITYSANLVSTIGR